MKRVRVGIIGTGFSAQAHVEALRRLPFVELVAVAASRQDKAEEAAARWGIPKAYGDARALIHDPDVDAVHNCTPNHLHFSLNREVLQAGKHLLSEKPLAMTSEESRELAALAEKSPGVSGVCYNYRHYPLVAQAREWVRSGEYGPVHLVYGGYLQDWLLYAIDYNWRLETGQNGASRAIADIGTHWCDTVQHVLGRRIVEVFADLKTVHPVRYKPSGTVKTFDSAEAGAREEVPISTEDYGSVLIHLEGGIQGVFTVSQVSAGRKNKLFFEIAAAEATISWDQENPNALWLGRRNEPNRELVRDPSLLAGKAAELAHYPGGHQEGWPDGLKNLFLDFYGEVIRRQAGEQATGSPSFASFRDGHHTMLIVEAILESHRTKRWVAVPSE